MAEASFCPSCGTARRPGGRFCVLCGTSFDDATAPAAVVAPVSPPRSPASITRSDELNLILAVAGAGVAALVGSFLWYVLLWGGDFFSSLLAAAVFGIAAGYLTTVMAGGAGIPTRLLAGGAVIVGILIRDILFFTDLSRAGAGDFLRFFIVTPRYFIALVTAVGIAVVVAGFPAWIPRWRGGRSA